jgi:ABC-2 type transport system ATP-binding protein
MPAPETSFQADSRQVIKAQALVRRFGHFVAVNRVDVTLDRGEVFGLLGANGAGKTTTIRLLCGTLAPTAGRITVAGVDMVRHARRARGRIGYVSQRFALYGDLQVEENLKLQAGLYGLSGKTKNDRIAWALQHLELASLRSIPASELPLGYKRRLALAAALLHQPQVLFLDEPTSGVDPLARQHFWELIYDLADAGIGILVTTHYMDEALFCDRIAFMHAGKVIAEDTPQNLQQQPLKTPLLQLQAADCGACFHLLQDLPQVLEIIPHAGSLNIRLKSGASSDQAMEQIQALARQHKVHIDKLQTLQADLEDVFVSMLEAVEQEGGV